MMKNRDMNTSNQNPSNTESEKIDSTELRSLLAEAYEMFPDQFQHVCVSDKAKANFPELDVIERLRAERDSHEKNNEPSE